MYCRIACFGGKQIKYIVCIHFAETFRIHIFCSFPGTLLPMISAYWSDPSAEILHKPGKLHCCSPSAALTALHRPLLLSQHVLYTVFIASSPTLQMEREMETTCLTKRGYTKHSSCAHCNAPSTPVPFHPL